MCRDITIAAKQMVGGHETFDIDIEAGRVDQLMELFGGDFVHLGNHLKLMNDRMVLVNPKYATENDQPPQNDNEPEQHSS